VKPWTAFVEWLRGKGTWISLFAVGGLVFGLLVVIYAAAALLGHKVGNALGVVLGLSAYWILPGAWFDSRRPARVGRIGLYTLPVSGPICFVVAAAVFCGGAIVFGVMWVIMAMSSGGNTSSDESDDAGSHQGPAANLGENGALVHRNGSGGYAGFSVEKGNDWTGTGAHTRHFDANGNYAGSSYRHGNDWTGHGAHVEHRDSAGRYSGSSYRRGKN
jgi:hypothetical protein